MRRQVKKEIPVTKCPPGPEEVHFQDWSHAEGFGYRHPQDSNNYLQIDHSYTPLFRQLDRLLRRCLLDTSSS